MILTCSFFLNNFVGADGENYEKFLGKFKNLLSNREPIRGVQQI
jgi:hypothetical protein